MAKSNVIAIDDLEKKIDRAVKETAMYYGNKMREIYRSAIEDFYSDYKPKRYNRTYNLYTGNSLYKKRKDSGVIPWRYLGYSVTMDVDYSYLEDQYTSRYRDGVVDTDWVFNNAVMSGIHGLENTRHFLNSKKKEDYYYPLGLSREAPKKMRTPPINIINKKINNITQSEISEKFSEYLSKML